MRVTPRDCGLVPATAGLPPKPRWTSAGPAAPEAQRVIRTHLAGPCRDRRTNGATGVRQRLGAATTGAEKSPLGRELHLYRTRAGRRRAPRRAGTGDRRTRHPRGRVARPRARRPLAALPDPSRCLPAPPCGGLTCPITRTAPQPGLVRPRTPHGSYLGRLQADASGSDHGDKGVVSKFWTWYPIVVMWYPPGTLVGGNLWR
jgi:hypothetical protein